MRRGASAAGIPSWTLVARVAYHARCRRTLESDLGKDWCLGDRLQNPFWRFDGGPGPLVLKPSPIYCRSVRLTLSDTVSPALTATSLEKGTKPGLRTST